MGLLVGRKAICGYWGGVSWSTVRRLAKKGLPILQENGSPPTMMTTHAEDWQRERLKKCKGMKKDEF